MAESALLIFTRLPEPGRTKTRLIPLLGAQGAAEFHKTILLQILAKARASDYATLELWCDSGRSHPFIKQCGVKFSSTIHHQQGEDLGHKMSFAIQDTLANHKFTALIGSDCPSLTTDILNQSHQHLYNGKDAVLGPAKDGGYYLIGLRKPNPFIFKGIVWGSADVASRTRKNFSQLGLDYIELQELADIDTADDYRQHQ